MASAEAPSRGEIWLVSLGAAKKGEPGKNRPAVVISADELLVGTEGELIVVVPLSSSRAPSKLRPPVSVVTGIDTELEPETLATVERALATVLGFDAASSWRSVLPAVAGGVQ